MNSLKNSAHVRPLKQSAILAAKDPTMPSLFQSSDFPSAGESRQHLRISRDYSVIKAEQSICKETNALTVIPNRQTFCGVVMNFRVLVDFT